MDILKRVEYLIKSGDVANLELLVKKEKTSLGDMKPFSFGEFLGLMKDSSADLLLPENIRSQLHVGAKEEVYPASYIYKLDLELFCKFASSLLQGKECYKTAPGSLSCNIISLQVNH